MKTGKTRTPRTNFWIPSLKLLLVTVISLSAALRRPARAARVEVRLKKRVLVQKLAVSGVYLIESWAENWAKHWTRKSRRQTTARPTRTANRSKWSQRQKTRNPRGCSVTALNSGTRGPTSRPKRWTGPPGSCATSTRVRSLHWASTGALQPTGRCPHTPHPSVSKWSGTSSVPLR